MSDTQKVVTPVQPEPNKPSDAPPKDVLKATDSISIEKS